MTVDDDNSRGFNATGNVECANNGALFLNNKSTPSDVKCSVTAKWTVEDDVECYTGKNNFSRLTGPSTLPFVKEKIIKKKSKNERTNPGITLHASHDRLQYFVVGYHDRHVV